jgi:hypothetical protein
VTEGTEEQLTVEDILGEASSAKFHTVLEMWREVLRSVDTLDVQRITPQWASRVVNMHAELRFRDMPRFRDKYIERVTELRTILEELIETDDECLLQTSAEEDVQHNSALYALVLTEWQKAILLWEMQWDCTSLDAAIDFATIAEVHKMFFGEQGLTGLLDQINFEFTDADREMLYGELEQLKQSEEG